MRPSESADGGDPARTTPPTEAAPWTGTTHATDPATPGEGAAPTEPVRPAGTGAGTALAVAGVGVALALASMLLPWFHLTLQRGSSGQHLRFTSIGSAFGPIFVVGVLVVLALLAAAATLGAPANRYLRLATAAAGLVVAVAVVGSLLAQHADIHEQAAALPPQEVVPGAGAEAGWYCGLLSALLLGASAYWLGPVPSWRRGRRPADEPGHAGTGDVRVERAYDETRRG